MVQKMNLYCDYPKQVRIDHCRKLLSSNQRVSKERTTTSLRRLKTLSGVPDAGPLGAIMAIFGLGVMLPDTLGGIVIGSLPLVFGLFILSKGLGEAAVGRIAQEMRENADAAMFSSYCGQLVFSAIFAVAMGYDKYIGGSDYQFLGCMDWSCSLCSGMDRYRVPCLYCWLYFPFERFILWKTNHPSCIRHGYLLRS